MSGVEEALAKRALEGDWDAAVALFASWLGQGRDVGEAVDMIGDVVDRGGMLPGGPAVGGEA